MSDPLPRLILPSEYEASGVVRLTHQSPNPTSEELEIVQGILGGPSSVVALTNPPSFFDQVHIYATHQLLIECMPEQELVGYLNASEVTAEDLITRISRIPFEPAMYLLSSIQKAIGFGRTDPSLHRQLMYEIYLNGLISAAGERFLRENERAAIFSEQQLFALQRLLVLHASDEETDALTPEQDIDLRLALFYTPGTVLTLDDDLETAEPESIDDERWVRYFIGNGGFAAHGWLKHDVARARRIYEVIANSNHAKKRDEANYCPLAEWLQNGYRMSLTELQAFGFVIYAGSHTNQQDGGPLAVMPDYFASTAFADRVEDGFSAFAADRAWYRTEFERSSENPRRAAFETAPFLRRPGLRLANGSVLVTSPRAIESWLSSTGTYYRLFDLARGKNSATRKKFTRFNGTLQEIYVRHLAHVAYPDPERRLGVGLVYGEHEYGKGKQTLKTSDVIIDLGLDLVFLEVTAKRLTEKTLVEADADSVRNDLRMMIVDKMKQLGRVISDVYAEPTRLPQVRLEYVERVWPIVVAADGVFHNPTVWAYTQKEAGHSLQFDRETVNATVEPIVMVDLDEVEILFGLVRSGVSLVELLDRKTSALWLQRDFKAMVSSDFAHLWDGDAEFISQEQRRAFKEIRIALDLRPEDGAAADREAA